MEAHLNTIIRQDLPQKAKHHLNRLLTAYDIEMVFYSREHVSSLPTLTVIAGKNMTDRQLEELQHMDWIKNSISEYHLIISMGKHHVEYSDFHFTYIVLNCHFRHLIYARTEKSWISRFQNDYSLKQNRYQKQFKEWVTHTETACENYHTKFIAPAPRTPQVFTIAMREIYTELLSAFRTYFLPKSLHEHDGELQILDFMRLHVPGIRHLAGKISLPVLSQILSSQCGHPDESFYREALEQAGLMRGMLNKNLPGIFHRNLTRTLLWNEYEQLYKNEQLQRHDDAMEITDRMVQMITADFKTDFIYLVKQRKESSGKSGVLLLITGPDFKLTQIHHLKQLLENAVPEIRVTLLLHKTEWFKKHHTVFHGFIDRFLTENSMLYQSRTKMEFPSAVESCRDQLVKKYWEERKKIIDSHWSTMEVARHCREEISTVHLKAIFQQLCLGLLYHHAHYVPNSTNINYLWELVEWFAPELTALPNADHMKNLLPLINRQEINFPQLESSPAVPAGAGIQEFMLGCSKMYDHLTTHLS